MGALGAPSLHPTGFGGSLTSFHDGLAVVGNWGSSPGKSSDAKKPYKKYGGDKQMAYMTAMFESLQKGLNKKKKASKKRKKRYDDSSSDSDSE